MNMMIPARRSDLPARPLDGCWYCEEDFNEAIAFERKRTERSRKRLPLLLVNIARIAETSSREELVGRLVRTLTAATRETDIRGWHRQDAVLGVIFTETNGTDPAVLQRKIEGALSAGLSLEEREKISLTYHAFPEDRGSRQPAADLTLYPELPKRKRARRPALFVKRTMDIAGSIAGILLFSPLLLLAPLLIKATSRGPVLFRQERTGQYGKVFTFLKFRTMYVDNDESVHREYVRNLIAGKAGSEGGEGGTAKVFKITNDDRITSVGRVLRKTSMDELPQFFNVLFGHMSLVGPRPPIPYEVEQYDLWHRRRVMEVKPGITGLWQVKGRSTTTFDEMVRLDLQYAREWSIWLDIRILCRTPWAVLRGKGAY